MLPTPAQEADESKHPRSLNEQGSFEAYCGEIRYLCGMLRECKGEKKVVEETDVVKAGGGDEEHYCMVESQGDGS